MRFTPTACLVLLLSIPAVAQCRATADSIPPIRGVRLGQHYDVVSMVFPDLTTKAGVRGVRYGEVVQSKSNEKRPSMKGARRIKFKFLDDRLVDLLVFYDHSISWKSVDEFAAHISNALEIPNRWQGTVYSNIRELSCADFFVMVVVQSSLTRALSITDTASVFEIARRERLAEERKKKSFKP